MITDHVIDRTVPIPLYYQLKTFIIMEIDKGSYKPGEVIPTEEELIAHFGVSRTTVRQAITELVQEGRLYRIKSKGTFVAENKINSDFIARLEPFNTQIERLGMTPSTEVLDFHKGVAPADVAEALHIQPNAQIVFLQRRRFADGVPVVLVKTYLPYDRCSFVMEHDFARESLYQTLAEHAPSFKVHHIQRVVEAIQAPHNIAQMLKCHTDVPLLFFTSTCYTTEGMPIEFSRAFYRGDRNKFEVTIVP